MVIQTQAAGNHPFPGLIYNAGMKGGENGVMEGSAKSANPVDLEGAPLRDTPVPGGLHRLYVAVTNHCNRRCPWCSTCSSPEGKTWIAMRDYLRSFPTEGPFEILLEGGEPALHPLLAEFIAAARAHPMVRRVVLCTNGSTIPADEQGTGRWLDSLGGPVEVRLSVNHHLLDNDPALLKKAVYMAGASAAGRLALNVNVRLRKGEDAENDAIRSAVRRSGLSPYANVFYLRRYGLAENEKDWDPPELVGTNFRMVNPDGKVFGPDLAARSEAMRRLP